MSSPVTMLTLLAAVMPLELLIDRLETAVQEYKKSEKTEGDLHKIVLAAQMVMTKTIVGNDMDKAKKIVTDMSKISDLQNIVDLKVDEEK